MTIAFNRSIDINLQLPYCKSDDRLPLELELRDLRKEMTDHEVLLLSRIQYLAEELHKKGEPIQAPKVYFAKSSAGPIKIGFTQGSLKGRAASLQTGNHGKVDLIGAIHGAGMAVESMLHQKFHCDRLNGEWFTPSDELMEIVNRHPYSESPPPKKCDCDICIGL